MTGRFPLVPALAIAFLLAAASDASAETRRLARDGGTLVYDLSGPQDGEAVVLLHCWGCSRDYWAEQVPGLAKEYRVLALDLPGHGESETAKAEWTYADIAEEIAAAADDAGLENFTAVGHSMGGPLALELAARHPERVDAVVGVDNLHDVGLNRIKDSGLTLTEENFEAQVKALVPAMVHPQSGPEVSERVARQIFASDRRVLLSLWAEYEKADFAAMLQAAGVPVRCVNAVPYSERSPATNVEGNRRFGDFDAAFMEGVGHYPMLEKPEEFTAELLKAIERASEAAKN